MEKINKKFEKKPDPLVEKLKGIILEMNKYYEGIGVPVTDDSRIDMNSFRDVYTDNEIKKDLEYVEKTKSGFERNYEETPLENAGEQLEVLVSIIFTKFAKDELIVVRSSEYDDIHGVDTIIVDIKTGFPLCTVDETSDMNEIGDKIDKLSLKNKTGSEVKYGISIEGNGEPNPQKCHLKGLPTLYIGLNPDLIKRTIRLMEPSLDESSIQEKNTFKYFVHALETSISRLRLHEIGITDVFHERLEELEEVIKDLKHISDSI